MEKTKVAINGFGRIGRTFFRQAFSREDMEIVAINDLGDLENLAYLLQYDTVYGRSSFSAAAKDGALVIDGNTIRFLNEKDPLQLPWKDMGVDVVVESTGAFESYEKAKVHLEAGAKRVVVTAPVSDDPAAAGIEGATVLMGVNNNKLENVHVSSNASCTTNASSPLISILHEGIGIERALLNTVHAYTATQSIQDAPAKHDFRRGRAAAENIVPNSTGAAIAVTKAYPALEGKFDGIAMRVPVPVGSIVDITFVASRPTSKEEVNTVLRAAAASPAWEGLFAVTDEQIVSSDIVGSTYAAIADLSFTRVVDGTLVKVLAWYDNEAGYANTLVRHIAAIGKFLRPS